MTDFKKLVLGKPNKKIRKKVKKRKQLRSKKGKWNSPEEVEAKMKKKRNMFVDVTDWF
jgi:hypothetical protein